MLAAPAGGRRSLGRAALAITETDRYDDHPRVRHARTLRDEVRVYATHDVLLTIGRGLAGRWELGVERTASPDQPPSDILSLLAGARDLLPPGGVLLAAVAPGNARALRSFLAAGYRPIGSDDPRRIRSPAAPENMKEPPLRGGSSRRKSGGVLLSQGVYPQVPSALAGLTAVFGMGTGVTPPLWPPETSCQSWFSHEDSRASTSVVQHPSPRPISTGRLNTLPCLHLRPINVMV